MNTNAKHYEILAIEPWEIMEKNFTTEEFVAYLKGNIIKYTLRDKGQALSDAEKIKHYAEKLIEVLEEKEEKGTKIDVYRPQVKHKFKVGDRVVSNKGQYDELTGTVKRLPTEGYQGREFYIIELDLEGEGWKANRVTHGVDCDNAWYITEDSLTLLEHEPVSEHKFKVGDHVEVTWLGSKETGVIVRTPTEQYSYKNSYLICLDDYNKGWTATKDEEGVDAENIWQIKESDIKLLHEEPKKTLEPNKWYDAQTFTVDELKELLPTGTKIKVLTNLNEDCKHGINYNLEEPKSGKVDKLDRVDEYAGDTAVFVEGDDLYYNWFKIIE